MGNQAMLDSTASRQHGVFNRAQCQEAGFEKGAILRRLESGQWLRLAPSVFAMASSVPSWERQVAAAVLSRPRAIVGGASSAALHEIRGFNPGRPVIVVPETSNARSAIASVVRHRRYDQIGIDRIRQLTTADLEETLVMVARTIGKRRLESIFDELMLGGRLDLQNLGRILDRESASRVRGLAPIAKLGRERGPDAPSADGSYLAALLESPLREAEIVGWTREAPMSLDGRPSRVDFFFPGDALVVEADGRSWHMRAEDFEVDRHRDNALQASGIRVLRFTYTMLTEEPEACIESIRQMIRLPAADVAV